MFLTLIVFNVEFVIHIHIREMGIKVHIETTFDSSYREVSGNRNFNVNVQSDKTFSKRKTSARHN